MRRVAPRGAVLAALVVGGALGFARPAAAATHISGATYSTDVTWTAAGSPYVLDGTVTVGAGATLTVEPGVVVKLNGAFRELRVSGTLRAVGTPSSRIVFTSIRDDTVGGDSGLDGPTVGAPGDWYDVSISAGMFSVMSYVDVRLGGNGSTNSGYGQVSVSGSSTSFAADHSTFTYGQRSGVRVYMAAVSLAEDTLSNNGNGLSLSTATATVSRSTIAGNGQYGIWFNLPNGWAPAATSVVDSEISGNGAQGVFIGANGDYPLSLMPHGTRNNIYGNAGGGTQLDVSG